LGFWQKKKKKKGANLKTGLLKAGAECAPEAYGRERQETGTRGKDSERHPKGTLFNKEKQKMVSIEKLRQQRSKGSS